IATSFVQVLRRPLESAQYACGAYSELLHRRGIQASMSRVGNPYDNAKAESFMKTLKQEEVQGLAYRDAEDARRRIGAFIDTVYNTQRLHSALDYLTPEEYEQMHPGGRRMEKAA
ncbi:integrase core domain-containing protein, partial [Mesorhizobium silamurunense]|uniref:integrase core domain-containing protein n=1 Tax=Mesorhizobium silamurunense TaxID=499528 RepID=UPI00177DDBFB